MCGEIIYDPNVLQNFRKDMDELFKIQKSSATLTNGKFVRNPERRSSRVSLQQFDKNYAEYKAKDGLELFLTLNVPLKYFNDLYQRNPNAKYLHRIDGEDRICEKINCMDFDEWVYIVDLYPFFVSKFNQKEMPRENHSGLNLEINDVHAWCGAFSKCDIFDYRQLIFNVLPSPKNN